MLNTLVKENKTPIHPFFLRLEALEQLPQTQRGFEDLLDRLRPTYSKVESAIRHDGEGMGALIYGDDKLIHVVESKEQSESMFLEELEDLVQFYKNPPRLWPGCRGSIAKKYGLTMTVEYNRWFDQFANVKPH